MVEYKSNDEGFENISEANDESWEDVYEANSVSKVLDGSNPGQFGNRFYEQPKKPLTRETLGAVLYRLRD
jgi:hypothetical protein